VRPTAASAEQQVADDQCTGPLFHALQIPLQLAATFTAAAQHNSKSPSTTAVMHVLDILLHKACDTGIASNTFSIQQQLQQSGMLQQLSAVLKAMTAELQAETANLAAGGCDAATWDVQQLVTAPGSLQSRLDAVVRLRYLLWEFWQGSLSTSAGFVGPGGPADAVMQFATAGLQYVSSIVQHVLPAMRQGFPQIAEPLIQKLQASSRLAWSLCTDISSASTTALSPLQQHMQDGEAGAWQQQLLLSPHLLPCVAAAVVMGTCHLSSSVAPQCGAKESSSSSSSKEPGSIGGQATEQLEQQQQCGRNSNSSSSGSSKGFDGTFTACQLQLLQLVGLTPEVVHLAMQQCDFGAMCRQISLALAACIDCCEASRQLLDTSSST
jgi:hypothetical protein